MVRFDTREGAAYGTAAATVVVAVALGLLSGGSVERASGTSPATGSVTSAYATR